MAEKDAVVESLLRENERLRQENRQLREIVDILNRKIETLEEEIAGLKKNREILPSRLPVILFYENAYRGVSCEKSLKG